MKARHPLFSAGSFLLGFSVWIALGITPVTAKGLSTDITGNHFFSARELNAITPEDPEKWSKRDLEDWRDEAVAQMEQLYRESGFFAATVSSDAKSDKTDATTWKVIFTIHEGPRYTYRKVRVLIYADSVSQDPEQIIEEGEQSHYVQWKNLEAKPRKPFQQDQLYTDRRTLMRAFGNAGFVRSRVKEQTVLEDSTHSVLVDYLVIRFDAVVFDTLVIDDRRAYPMDSLPGVTRDEILRSLVPYQRGDTMRVGDNDKLIEKLQSTGLFNYVRISDSLVANADHRSAMILNVEEKIPGHVQASLFYETTYGLGLSLGAQHSNFAGSLHEWRGSALFAYNRQNFSAGFGSPLLWGQLLRFDNDATVEWSQINLPNKPFFGGDFTAGNVASLSRSLTRWLRVVSSLEMAYQSQLVQDSSTLQFNRESGGTLNLINTVFLSFLNQFIDPTRGTRFAFTYGNGGPIYERGAVRVFEDRHNWLEAKSAYYYYLPPYDNFKLALRLDGGRFFGAGGLNAEKFFLGGSRNVRSYGFRELCPDEEPPERGSCAQKQGALEPAYVLSSMELRLGLFNFGFMGNGKVAGFLKPLEIVPFFDYGRVWNLISTPTQYNTHFFTSGYGYGIAQGFGFRYPLLGVFNLRLDFAYGRPGNGAWPDAWMLDLAQAF